MEDNMLATKQLFSKGKQINSVKTNSVSPYRTQDKQNKQRKNKTKIKHTHTALSL